MFIRRYDHQTEEEAEHQAVLAACFPKLCLCIGLVLLLLEQIKPIEQLVPVS